MGALSRRKGRKWEQDVVRLLKPIFGDQVKRGLAQSRFGASEAPDAANVPGWWVECKHGKLVNLRAALEQARDALAAATPTADSRRPVAFCKDDRSKPVAVLYLDDFLALLQEWWTPRYAAPAVVTEAERLRRIRQVRDKFDRGEVPNTADDVDAAMALVTDNPKP